MRCIAGRCTRRKVTGVRCTVGSCGWGEVCDVLCGLSGEASVRYTVHGSPIAVLLEAAID